MTVEVRGRPILVCWLSLAAVFFIPLSRLKVGSLGNVSDVLLIAAAIGWVWYWSAKKVRLRPSIGFLVWFGSSFTGVLLICGSYYAANLQEALFNALKLGLSITSTFIVCASINFFNGLVERTMLAFAAGGLALALSLWVLPSSSVAGRAVGLASNPVEIGGTIAAIAAYMVVKRSSSAWGLILCLGVAGLLVSGFVAAETATGPVALVGGVACGILLVRNVELVKRAGVAAGLFVVFFVIKRVEGSDEIYSKILRSFGVDSGRSTTGAFNTLNSRWTTIQLGYQKILEHPILGSGMDTAGGLAYRTLSPHNILVHAWLVGGVILLAFFLGLLFLTLWAILLSFRGRDLLNGNYAALVACSAAAWFGALSGPAVYSRVWIFPVIMLLSVAAANHPVLENESESEVEKVRIAH